MLGRGIHACPGRAVPKGRLSVIAVRGTCAASEIASEVLMVAVGEAVEFRSRWSLRERGMFARTKSPRRYTRDVTHASQNLTNREPTGAISNIHKGHTTRTSSTEGGRAHSPPGLHFAINGRIAVVIHGGVLSSMLVVINGGVLSSMSVIINGGIIKHHIVASLHGCGPSSGG